MKLIHVICLLYPDQINLHHWVQCLDSNGEYRDAAQESHKGKISPLPHLQFNYKAGWCNFLKEE